MRILPELGAVPCSGRIARKGRRNEEKYSPGVRLQRHWQILVLDLLHLQCKAGRCVAKVLLSVSIYRHTSLSEARDSVPGWEQRKDNVMLK